jgi:tRNA threonylcarbamoyladenosine biosynthesis protein TsaB
MTPRFILGIETSGTESGVALLRGDELLLAVNRPTGAAHNEALPLLLEAAFRDSGVGPAGLDGIGVTIGPGMFTSLRVGLSVAKSIALVRDIPVVGVGTLPALAATVGPGRPVLAVIDARKAQVYAALYDHGRELLAPCVVMPAELPSLLPAGLRPVVAGSGAGLCVGPLRESGVDVCESGIIQPLPAVIARTAATAIAAGNVGTPDDIEPLYIRRTDAELSRSAGRPG